MALPLCQTRLVLITLGTLVTLGGGWLAEGRGQLATTSQWEFVDLDLAPQPVVFPAAQDTIAVSESPADEVDLPLTFAEPPQPSAAAEPIRPQSPPSLVGRAGYDRGFFIASDRGPDRPAGDEAYFLRLNGWGHFRMTNSEAFGGNEGFNQLQLKRARLIFSGHAFTPAFSWLVALDGRSQADGAIRLLDYFLDYDLGSAALGLDAKRLALKLGQYKVPFTLSRFLSAQEMQFTDRSVSSMFFDANRSLAFGAYGESQQSAALWTWETAVFNGLVTGGAETGAAGGLDNNFAVSGRLAIYLGGDWGSDDQCDYDFHESPAYRLGGAFAASNIDRIGQTEFAAIRVADSGQRLSDLLPAQVSGYRVNKYALDASVKYRGWSMTTEYYFRNIGGFQGDSLPGLFDHGFSLDVGYFVIPQKMELLARWSRVVGNSGTLGLGNRSADERSLGGVWYFRRHAAKLTVDASYLDGAPIDAFSLDIFPGQRGWLMRTQLQFSF